MFRLINESVAQRTAQTPEGTVRVRPYLAYLKGNTAPVGFSYMLHMPKTPIVLMGGAATHPDVRGRGVYSTLVARRLADARAEGVQAAVIQAVKTTSAPTARRIGFRDLCDVELYAWFPPAVGGPAALAGTTHA